MSQEETKAEISKVPINILFDPEGVKKKNIWEIDLIQILSVLIKVLEKADKKDLRIAGMAAHESTYPVSLDELLDLLENLIGTIANPRERRSNQLKFEPVDAPDFKKYFNNLENIIGQYQDLVLKKLESNGTALLESITKDLDTTDSIRCFFAILFLARDEKVDLMQVDDDIRITVIKE